MPNRNSKSTQHGVLGLV